jgi:hypothetical protein
MTELVGACVVTTILLAVVLLDALRLHGHVLRRLHELEPQAPLVTEVPVVTGPVVSEPPGSTTGPDHDDAVAPPPSS